MKYGGALLRAVALVDRRTYLICWIVQATIGEHQLTVPEALRSARVHLRCQLFPDCAKVHRVFDDVEVVLPRHAGGSRTHTTTHTNAEIRTQRCTTYTAEMSLLTGIPSFTGSTGSMNGQLSLWRATALMTVPRKNCNWLVHLPAGLGTCKSKAQHSYTKSTIDSIKRRSRTYRRVWGGNRRVAVVVAMRRTTNSLPRSSIHVQGTFRGCLWLPHTILSHWHWMVSDRRWCAQGFRKHRVRRPSWATVHLRHQAEGETSGRIAFAPIICCHRRRRHRESWLHRSPSKATFQTGWSHAADKQQRNSASTSNGEQLASDNGEDNVQYTPHREWENEQKLSLLPRVKIPRKHSLFIPRAAHSNTGTNFLAELELKCASSNRRRFSLYMHCAHWAFTHSPNAAQWHWLPWTWRSQRSQENHNLRRCHFILPNACVATNAVLRCRCRQIVAVQHKVSVNLWSDADPSAEPCGD